MKILSKIFAALIAATLSLNLWAASALIEAEQLKQRLGEPRLVLIDLRSEADYQAGHIPGATNAAYGSYGWRATVDGIVGKLPPVAELAAKVGALGVSPESWVVLIPYGANSSDIGSAARVYWTFKYLGHEQVSIVNGGHRAWQAGAYALSKQAESYEQQAPYPVNLNEQLLVTSAELKSRLESDDLQTVDARTNLQYDGWEKHPKALRGGALPASQRLPQQDLVDPKTGKFYSSEQILQVATANGWLPQSGVELVSYCNTGHWAATSWFALSEVAGVEDVRLYDGSMVEWTSDAEAPLQNQRSRIELLWYEAKKWWQS